MLAASASGGACFGAGWRVLPKLIPAQSRKVRQTQKWRMCAGIRSVINMMVLPRSVALSSYAVHPTQQISLAAPHALACARDADAGDGCAQCHARFVLRRRSLPQRAGGY